MLDLNFFNNLIKDITNDINYNISNQHDFKLEKILKNLDNKNLPPHIRNELEEFFKAGIDPSLISFFLNFFKKVNQEQTFLDLADWYIKYRKTNNKIFVAGIIFESFKLLKANEQENTVFLFLNLFKKFKVNHDTNLDQLLLLIAIKNYFLILLQSLFTWHKESTTEELLKYLVFWTTFYVHRNIYGNKYEKFFFLYFAQIEQNFLSDIKEFKDLNQIQEFYKKFSSKIEEIYLQKMNQIRD